MPKAFDDHMCKESGSSSQSSGILTSRIVESSKTWRLGLGRIMNESDIVKVPKGLKGDLGLKNNIQIYVKRRQK